MADPEQGFLCAFPRKGCSIHNMYVKHCHSLCFQFKVLWQLIQRADQNMTGHQRAWISSPPPPINKKEKASGSSGSPNMTSGYFLLRELMSRESMAVIIIPRAAAICRIKWLIKGINPDKGLLSCVTVKRFGSRYQTIDDRRLQKKKKKKIPNNNIRSADDQWAEGLSDNQ